MPNSPFVSRAAVALVISIGACVPSAVSQAKTTPARNTAVESAIGMLVNGDELPREPAPRVVGKGGGRIVVPVVRVYNALGITVSRDGNEITAIAPGKRIVLHLGSTQAQIDTTTVTLDSPAIEIGGATYVPLRFIVDSLGAQATFNARANRVEIVSALVGRNPTLERRGDRGTSTVAGNVSAIDLNSAPESITVERGSNVRTVAITSDAKIALQDVLARTSIAGSLADIRVGDSVEVIVRKDGRVESIAARYATRTGTIAAVSPATFVLNSGFVVTLDRSTELTLNAQPAKLADLRVGDSVVVRSNPDTNEKRGVIVSRAVAATPQSSPSAVSITALTISGKGALRPGDSFDVTLRGTPGGRATFDIGTYVPALPMNENAPGVYSAKYTVPAGANFGNTPIYGHLSAGGSDAPRAEAQSLVAVSSTPPQVVDIAPAAGQIINNSKPSIFATFHSPTDIGISAAATTINVAGLDVTASATRSDSYITYSPSVALPDGPVEVVVRVADRAGNTQTRRWTFTIRTH